MPRIRTIKPEILTDEKTSELSSKTWRLFVSMISLADDHGNLRAKPGLLQAQVFHSCPDKIEIEKLLSELEKLGLILLYDVGEQRYANIVNFKRHQRVDNAGKPHVPGPDSPSAEIRRESPHLAAGSKDLRIKGSKDQEPAAGRRDEVELVWNFYLEFHPRSKLDKKRRKMITDRLDDGWSVDELKQAVSNLHKTPWNLGDNGKGIKYLEPEYAFRDSQMVEKRLAFSEAEPIAKPKTELEKLRRRAKIDEARRKQERNRNAEQRN